MSTSSQQHPTQARFVRGIVLLLACLAPVSGLQAAPKTDVVVFDNGDRLTGEIKRLDRGKLELSTDNAGTVYIEWDKVASIQTGQRLDVETVDGHHYFGALPAVGEAGARGAMKLVVDGDPEGHTVQMAQVVRIATIDQGSLIGRLDGYITVGFNYTKANNETQFNLSGGVNSRDEIREWSLDGSMALNSQSGESTTSMYDVSLANKRFLEHRWFVQTFGTVQGNEELGLNIREIAGGGLGRFLVQGPHAEWSAVGGLAVSHENFESEPTRNSLEALIATQYSFFQYDTPKRTVDAGIALFPSLTESGRLRAEADIDSRFEIVKDLFFGVTIYGSYDSEADPAAPSNSDYGVVTSLGYTF